MVPAQSASISFISFIASTMQSAWPSRMALPDLDEGRRVGRRRAVEGADERRGDVDDVAVVGRGGRRARRRRRRRERGRPRAPAAAGRRRRARPRGGRQPNARLARPRTRTRRRCASARSRTSSAELSVEVECHGRPTGRAGFYRTAPGRGKPVLSLRAASVPSMCWSTPASPSSTSARRTPRRARRRRARSASGGGTARARRGSRGGPRPSGSAARLDGVEERDRGVRVGAGVEHDRRRSRRPCRARSSRDQLALVVRLRGRRPRRPRALARRLDEARGRRRAWSSRRCRARACPRGPGSDRRGPGSGAGAMARATTAL